uniref:Zinc finger with KRAB and SCAN domains 7 n=1 Tax=Molossus molossus TaxID=27622 RepID=A0A7J8DEX3_MOLMO|nr:zinc finger with KRAB and SCAN domains 7 [Molossus molossus]
MLPRDVWATGGAEPTSGALPLVAHARGAHQGADPGAAGAGAVSEHPARRAPDLGAATSPREWRGSCGCGGGFPETPQWTRRVFRELGSHLEIHTALLAGRRSARWSEYRTMAAR